MIRYIITISDDGSAYVQENIDNKESMLDFQGLNYVLQSTKRNVEYLWKSRKEDISINYLDMQVLESFLKKIGYKALVSNEHWAVYTRENDSYYFQKCYDKWIMYHKVEL
jgi:hypothetical protein